MFRMIGGDGREYGPVTADELRDWIHQHRADGRTLVRAEDGREWKPLAALPEFAADLAGSTLPAAATADAAPGTAPSPSFAPAPAPTEASPERTEEELLRSDFELNVTDCLGRGWQLLGSHLGLMALAGSLVWLILMAASLNCLGAVAGLAIAGALHGGLMRVYLGLIRGQPTGLGDVFSCFNVTFLPLMLVWLFTLFASTFGMMLCVVPGIYLKVIWAFSLTLAADRRLPFVEALELSRRMVSKHWFRVAGLMLVAWLPVIVISLFNSHRLWEYLTMTLGDPSQGIGLAAFLQNFGHKWRQVSEYAAKLEFQKEIVVLFNLPFAYAAMLQAYESIFGKSRAQGH